MPVRPSQYRSWWTAPIFQGAFFLIVTGGVVLLVGADITSPVNSLLIFLPGTQPGTSDTLNGLGSTECKQCHASESTIRPVSLYKEWSGSMMAHSARDPIFYASLAIANKYSANVGVNIGEFCIRCHSPTGWLAGRSEDISGASLRGTDLDGVQCDYCHRMVDPLFPDSTVPDMIFDVPGYGNGMHVMQRTLQPKRGPYDSLSGPHQTRRDPFQQRGDMCGVCHDVSNPFHAGYQGQLVNPPHTYGSLERTYSEWLMSDFSAMGDSGSCQSCHMRKTTGYGCSYGSAPLRSDLAQHDLTGGNTFVPDILRDFFPELDSVPLRQGKQRATETLQRAASLSLSAYRAGDSSSVIADVRITNLTGHKLPTGYPEGRRMWLSVIGTNAAGDTLFTSGYYDSLVADITDTTQLKLYHAIHGIRDSTGLLYGLPAGPSFHFSVNDTILFDNRIPPRGYTYSNFRQRLAEPIGVVYADSQYWDDTRYLLPAAVTSVSVSLQYQTITKEYIEFLRDHNVGNSFDWNDWGSKLYDAWERRGKSTPVVMNFASVAVGDSSMSVPEVQTGIPQSIHLFQNYPNPFNPSTHFRFTLPKADFVSLKVFDLLGREVATIVHEKLPAGDFERVWDSSELRLPSGVYLYRLVVGEVSIARKLMLLR